MKLGTQRQFLWPVLKQSDETGGFNNGVNQGTHQQTLLPWQQEFLDDT